MPRSRLPVLLVAAVLAVVASVAVVVLVTGGDEDDGRRAGSLTQYSATQATPPPPDGGDATATIQAWADTLASGDEEGAAAYFALPALVQTSPGAPPVRMTSQAEILAFNRALPCGARMLDAAAHGRYTIATFRLIERPGATCDGPGGRAATAFLVRDGRIVEWRRVPDVAPGPANPDAGPVV